MDSPIGGRVPPAGAPAHRSQSAQMQSHEILQLRTLVEPSLVAFFRRFPPRGSVPRVRLGTPALAAVKHRLGTAGRRRRRCVHCEDMLRRRDDLATCLLKKAIAAVPRYVTRRGQWFRSSSQIHHHWRASETKGPSSRRVLIVSPTHPARRPGLPTSSRGRQPRVSEVGRCRPAAYERIRNSPRGAPGGAAGRHLARGQAQPLGGCRTSR